ncbi:MAG TPA: dihydroneopterin aldolase [Prosthecobacter sp.]
MTPPPAAATTAKDEIRLHGLDLPVQIGVPEEERAAWQTLQADLTLRVAGRFEALEDRLERTVDYAAVAVRVKALAAERPRQLLETLAAEIAACILSEFAVGGITVCLRKRILPGCDYVSVCLTRP